MRTKSFYGTVTVEADNDDGPSIVIDVDDEGGGGQWRPNSCFASLTIEAAAKVAEEIDSAIDLLARTERARNDARKARIAALKSLLAELEGQP